jgi:hypothetical protein
MSEVAAPILLNFVETKLIVEWDRVATYYHYLKTSMPAENGQDVS